MLRLEGTNRYNVLQASKDWSRVEKYNYFKIIESVFFYVTICCATRETVLKC